MKKLTTILEAHSKQQRVKNISSKEEFFKYVHETLSSHKTYNGESANMIAENLISTYNDDWQKAAKELANFQ